ncbi:DMT family transporter [Salinisphaera aquimarina]|uniref:DMT family transporter n=1 Tax=Salinisphaera aquimarina TaxID=2094031 RepID=A0ABV7ER56_9GAMM
MPAGINIVMGAREWVMLITLSLLWGGSFFFVGVAVHDLPPLTIVNLRVGIGAIALWAIALAMGLRPPTNARIWFAFAGLSVLNNMIPFVLIAWAQIQIASGLASILNATTPLFTVVVAGLLLTDEKATPLKLAGVVTGFLGVVVMIGVPDTGAAANSWAPFAVLVAAFCYACGGVYGRRFKAMAIDPVFVATGQVSVSALLLLPITLSVDGLPDLAGPSAATWASVVALAVLSTSVAYVLYFRILEAAGATNLLLVTLLVPVSAILLGAVFLHEDLRPVDFAGMALIALGLSAIDGRPWRPAIWRRMLRLPG